MVLMVYVRERWGYLERCELSWMVLICEREVGLF